MAGAADSAGVGQAASGAGPWPGAGEVLAAAFEGARMPMLVTDPRLPDHPIVHVNDAFLELTGYAREEVVGRNCRFMQGPLTDRDTVAAVRRAVAAGEHVSVEILNYRRDGAPFWNALYVSPVRDAQGRVAYFFASQLDVTAKKELELRLQDANARLEAEVERRTRDLTEALRAKEVLVHEVDHRVKNNLQLVVSLLSVQARRVADAAVRRHLQQALERMTALSLVHQALYQAADPGRFDVSAFARRLAQDLLAASGRDGEIGLELDLEPVEVPARKGAPLALILNELLTNALRHAFPGEGGGGTLRLAVRREEGGGRFRVAVEDDGVGLAHLPPRGGFGATLVRSLARQLAADLAWEGVAAPGGRGTRARLTLPVNGNAHDRHAAA